MKFLYFYPDTSHKDPACIAWKVVRNGHIANVTEDTLSASIKIYGTDGYHAVFP
jgi:hypothetical protein